MSENARRRIGFSAWFDLTSDCNPFLSLPSYLYTDSITLNSYTLMRCFISWRNIWVTATPW